MELKQPFAESATNLKGNIVIIINQKTITPDEMSDLRDMLAKWYNPIVQKALINTNKTSDMFAHYAALNGHVAVIAELAAHGADLSAKDDYGDTPAHYAALNDHGVVITELAAHGAALSIRNKNGQTPANDAAAMGRPHLSAYIEDLVKNVDYTPALEILNTNPPPQLS
jgi:ankyrin repeat protein